MTLDNDSKKVNIDSELRVSSLHTNNRSNVESVKLLYDRDLLQGEVIRQLIFPNVFGTDQYIGQYSDNTADDIRRLAESARIKSDTLVLDIGCGAAGPACFIAKEFNCKITGVDLSDHHLEAAKKRVVLMGLSEKISLISGDIYQIAPKLKLRPADVAIGLGAWCHFNPRDFFPHCWNLLSPGGRIAFMIYWFDKSMMPSLYQSIVFTVARILQHLIAVAEEAKAPITLK